MPRNEVHDLHLFEKEERMKKTRTEIAIRSCSTWEAEASALAVRLGVSAKKMRKAVEQLLIHHAAQCLYDKRCRDVLPDAVTTVLSKRQKRATKSAPRTNPDQAVARHFKGKEAEFPGA